MKHPKQWEVWFKRNKKREKTIISQRVKACPQNQYLSSKQKAAKPKTAPVSYVCTSVRWESKKKKYISQRLFEWPESLACCGPTLLPGMDKQGLLWWCRSHWKLPVMVREGDTWWSCVCRTQNPLISLGRMSLKASGICQHQQRGLIKAQESAAALKLCGNNHIY